MEFLVPLLAALFIGAAVLEHGDNRDQTGSGGGDPDPDTGGGDPLVPSGPTEGDDVLSLAAGTRGNVDALAGDDTITAVGNSTAQIFTNEPFGPTWPESVEYLPPLLIYGGEGDDDVTLSGTGLEARGGVGNDIARLNGLSEAVITGFETVIGQDSTDLVASGGSADLLIFMPDNGQFVGGSSDETVYGGASVAGNSGDDVLYSNGQAASLSGGDGNDLLVGKKEWLAPTASRLEHFLATDADTLSGGAGDDTLSGSHADLMTGGAGANSFVAYTDTEYWAARSIPQPTATVITDFDPVQDQLVIYYDETFGAGPGGPPSHVGRITTDVTPEGAFRVLGDGVPLVALNDISSARVGLSLGFEGGSDVTYTRLDGTPANADDFDIIVRYYYAV